MSIVDKQNKLQWCNLTLNDKGSQVSRTYFKNILGTQISYLCNLCKCLQIFHKLYIGEEHKAYVV